MLSRRFDRIFLQVVNSETKLACLNQHFWPYQVEGLPKDGFCKGGLGQGGSVFTKLFSQDSYNFPLSPWIAQYRFSGENAHIKRITYFND